MPYTRSELVPQLEPLLLSSWLIDVLAVLLQGESNKMIARELDLSLQTVKEYVATILRRLSVSSRAQVPMSVRSYHETLLAWDVARRERGWPHLAEQMTVSHIETGSMVAFRARRIAPKGQGRHSGGSSTPPRPVADTANLNSVSSLP